MVTNGLVRLRLSASDRYQHSPVFWVNFWLRSREYITDCTADSRDGNVYSKSHQIKCHMWLL